MSVAKEFSKEAGEFISASKAAELVKETRQAKDAAGQDPYSYLHSQFFGIDKLQEMISKAGPDLAGFKINLLLEGEEHDDEGLLIAPVDKNGKVLEGGDDGEEEFPGGGGGIVLFGGPKCPRTCLPPLDDDD